MKGSRLVISVNAGPASRRKGSLEDMFDTTAELQKKVRSDQAFLVH